MQKRILHTDVWYAMDTMAVKNSLSPSGMAVRCGMCATAFNKSKRENVNGKPRWPSMQSLVKVLNTIEQPMGYFADIMDTIVAERVARERSDKK